MSASHLIEIDPEVIILNDSDGQGEFIYGHLLYFYSKFSPIPAISAKIVDGRVVAVRDGVRASISTDLKRSSQRVLIRSSDEGIGQIGAPFKLLDFEEEKNDANAINNVNGFHVFYLNDNAGRQDAKKLSFSLFQILSRFDLLERSFRIIFQIEIVMRFISSLGFCLSFLTHGLAPLLKMQK